MEFHGKFHQLTEGFSPGLRHLYNAFFEFLLSQMNINATSYVTCKYFKCLFQVNIMYFCNVVYDAW
jgi:hypothetical protein